MGIYKRNTSFMEGEGEKLFRIGVAEEEDLTTMADVISRINSIEESHIGYCGNDKDEINKSLTDEISDIPYTNSFVVAYEKNEMIGVLGFDADVEDNSAEVWGPFIVRDRWEIAPDMWEMMDSLLPEEITSLEMFPNLSNTKAIQLANSLSFEKGSDETVLVFRRDSAKKLENTEIEEINAEQYSNMQQLHDEVFPHTYYSGKQIIERLNEHRKVFVIIDNGLLCGYIYAEVEPEFGEASIEFFGVEQSARGKGIGKELITGALKWIFTFEGIKTVELCVNSTNAGAISLYKRVGFQHLHDLVSLTKNLN